MTTPDPAPSWSGVLKPDPERDQTQFEAANETLGLSSHAYCPAIAQVKTGFEEVLTLFGLTDRGAGDALERLISMAQPKDPACTS